jgi:hypothetical protein
MNEPDRPTPTDPNLRPSAPEPAGEIVPGHPPVPITVWHLPPPRPGEVVPANVTRRLAANYTHAGSAATALVTATPPLPGHHRPGGGRGVRLELVITTWPMTGSADTAATVHVRGCVELLAPDGCLAVVLANGDIPDQLGDLVGVARDTGLTYLQHIVVAHTLRPRPAPASLPQVNAVRSPGARRAARERSSGWRHLRVHTDILVFRKPGAGAGD